SLLGIGAEWPSERDRHIRIQVSGEDSLGGDSILDPLLQRVERVEGRGSGSPRAVAHFGDHEQTCELLNIFQGYRPPSHGGHQVVVIVDAVVRRNKSIGKAVIHDQLATSRPEGADVWADRVEGGSVGFTGNGFGVGVSEIGIEIERMVVEVWVIAVDA